MAQRRVRRSRPFKFREGSWGILRVLDPAADGDRLRRLPDRGVQTPATGDVCPAGAPERRFGVHAIDAPGRLMGSRAGAVFVLASDLRSTLGGDREPEPLVLRIRVGDCLVVDLTNDPAVGDFSFHADQLVADPATDVGISVGRNPPQTIGPGEHHSYRLFVDPTVGETVALITDGGDVVSGPGRGLDGAVVIAPADARFADPWSGSDISGRSQRDAVVLSSSAGYRDVVVFLHDIDEAIGTHRMPYSTQVQGAVGIDYRAAEGPPRPGTAESPTPPIEANAGDHIRLHLLAPVSEQAQLFSVEGHTWLAQPGVEGTRRVDSVLLGGLEAITLHIDAAGGPLGLSGAYVYGDHRLPYREVGLWGILRVRVRDDPAGPLHLADIPCDLACRGMTDRAGRPGVPR